MATLVTGTGTQNHQVVSAAEWTTKRKELLNKEKEFTRLRDELSRERRELPWEKVEKNYVFDGPNGKESLADLFAGRSQLIIYHFMFGPDWEQGCPSCSLIADGFDGTLIHLANRDVTLAVVSRAPIEKIEAFRKRMGWKFHWVSSFQNSFNFDSHVSFTKEEMASGKVYYNYTMQGFGSDEAPGGSAFYKNEQNEIFHTYSSFQRGLDMNINTYNFLDIAPKGRNEEGLPYPMAWVRHHDRYDQKYFVDPKTTDTVSKGGSCCSGESHS